MANKKKFKMFEASRIRFDQLKEDVTKLFIQKAKLIQESTK